MKYKVISNLHHDNQEYKAGEEVELSQSQAKPLLENGVIERVIKPFSGNQPGSSTVN